MVRDWGEFGKFGTATRTLGSGRELQGGHEGDLQGGHEGDIYREGMRVIYREGMMVSCVIRMDSRRRDGTTGHFFWYGGRDFGAQGD